MYQKISIVAFIAVFCGIALNCLIRPCRDCLRHPIKALVHFFTLIFLEQKLSVAGVFRKLVYLLALLSFMVLAVTGFYPTLVLGEHISGYMIMIHATFAPILAICIAILAVMWAGNCRFNNKDWPWLHRLIQRVTLVKSAETNNDNHDTIGLWQKITFWLIIFLALPLALSIILSMLPYFGTHWQELLLWIHRYTALVFALAVIVHTHLIVRSQMKR